MLSSGIQVTPGMTGDQVKEFMQGQLNHDETIAYGIGWSVQVALTLVSFPPTSALLMLHRRFNNDPGASLTEAATTYATLPKFMPFAPIGGDVLTDFLFVP